MMGGFPGRLVAPRERKVSSGGEKESGKKVRSVIETTRKATNGTYIGGTVGKVEGTVSPSRPRGKENACRREKTRSGRCQADVNEGQTTAIAWNDLRED